MNIRAKLKAIKNYYDVTRCVGHTTGMLEGANYTANALILTHNLRSAEDIKKKLGSPSSVRLESLHSDNMLVGYSRPLFIDNAAMWLLMREALAEIESLDAQNKSLRDSLKEFAFSPP